MPTETACIPSMRHHALQDQAPGDNKKDLEEQDDGVEMNADFDGELYDVERDPADDNADDKEDGDEVCLGAVISAGGWREVYVGGRARDRWVGGEPRLVVRSHNNRASKESNAQALVT